MSKIKFYVMFLLFVPMLSWAAQDRVFGIGAIIGNPTGISGELLLENNNTIDFAAAWSTWRYIGFHVHADFLWTDNPFFQVRQVPVEWYFGVGGRLVSITNDKHEGKSAIGPRVPVGMYFYIPETPIKVFGELAATLNLTPATDVDLGAAIGARFYF